MDHMTERMSDHPYFITPSPRMSIVDLVRFAHISVIIESSITEGALPEFACSVHLSPTCQCSPGCTQHSSRASSLMECIDAKASSSPSLSRGLGFDFPGTVATRHDRLLLKRSLCRISIGNKHRTQNVHYLLYHRVLFQHSPTWIPIDCRSSSRFIGLQEAYGHAQLCRSSIRTLRPSNSPPRHCK